jgi:FMN phosphatase YigB (HAD superfamily)
MGKAVFIDFYGTLCHGKFWRGLDAATFEKIQDLVFGADHDLVNAWMTGGYTAEDINHIICERLGLDREMLWSAFLKGCEAMRADQASLDIIQSLKESFRFILITDNMDSFDRFVLPKMGLTSHFDKIFNSFNTKRLKSNRDGRAFTDAMNTCGLLPHQCVLIDDSPRTCDIFTKLGGRAYLVTERTPLFYWLARIQEDAAKPVSTTTP